MNPAARQRRLLEQFAILPDPQERLAGIVNRRPRIATLPPEERCDELLVPGCVSKVWIRGSIDGGRFRLQADADAHVVRGLVMFLGELFDDSNPADAANFEPTILDELGITRMLTPTRLNGLTQVCRRIRELARR